MRPRHALLAPILLLAGCASTPEPALLSALEAGWEGERVCELLHETPGDRMLRCTFAPGVGHERHYHPPHYGYALSGGTMQITDAGGTREVRLETGSSYRSEGTAWHEVVNVGDTPVIYLIVEEKPDGR
ncbi:cupin domain-containing protein [Paraurantiacibacter namhicola]|uniref:Cupin domain protein n=1 Tax=Paraurantiacibacter namhicola TaxID=645517 RepID=A0A1C7D5P6_9SPHN|nr:cupin domain-containing protein [Paraurantiacibacter namhicola]ANU06789.1 Cupin domain protein [Paraurantiacibacter namhicola]